MTNKIHLSKLIHSFSRVEWIVVETFFPASITAIETLQSELVFKTPSYKWKQ